MFSNIPQDSLKKIIDSTILLIENTEYRDIINKHVNIQTLKNLVLDLVRKFTETEELNLKKKWLNELMSNIQDALKFRTNSTFPENIDFYRIVSDYKKVEKFEQIVSSLKTEREIDRKDIRGFKIVARTKRYTGKFVVGITICISHIL